MRRVWTCRRTFVAVLGMCMLLALGLLGREPVAGSIVTICMAIAAANATEATLKHKASAQNDSIPR